ncbi:hypothetical protein DH2020_005601 [Rehmannia glutinosa]|uniref:Late embryogenesis abundant protein LEA-2 subgroup domain-containing protein n=1 Tax=Rehmannia glutinosa TaxID=99300 RepID=A0ABR0XGJ7_REHGL
MSISIKISSINLVYHFTTNKRQQQMLRLHSPRRRLAKHRLPNIQPRRAANQRSDSPAIKRHRESTELRTDIAEHDRGGRNPTAQHEFLRFEFRSGNTILMYENATIGAASIHEGRVDGRKNREMNVTLKVNYMNFSIDIGLLGLVKLRSFAELRGEVRVVKIINRGKSAVMNCTMDLNLTSQVIQDLSCQ